MENLAFIGTGFGIVMGVLAALWGVCAVVGLVFKSVETRRKAAAEKPAAPAHPAPEAGTPGGPPPGHLAAIAAAVASMSPAYRVVRVAAPGHVAKAWAAQGRLEQQTSGRNLARWAAPGHAARNMTNSHGNEG